MTGSDRPAGVVLAAGAGTRLRPLTALRPKALCPVGGVPLLDRALARLAPRTGSGPAALAVNVHHLANQVVAHVADRAHVATEHPEALGTAGALGALRPWLDGRDVLVTNADTLLVGDRADPSLLTDGWDGERCRLLVEPADGRRPDVAGGWRYVGTALLPWALVQRLAASPSGLYEVLWAAEDRAGRLDLVTADGTAVDCGTPADYLRANLLVSGGASVVGRGAVVEGRLTRCVVWDGAVVGADEDLVDVVRAGDAEHPVTVGA